MNKMNAMGVMSGTSLDGTDLAFCHFYQKKGKWKFELIRAITIPYDEYWKNKLSTAHSLNAFDFLKLHNEYGIYIGEIINHFKENISENVEFIVSHGHTIFHQPEIGLTFQLGEGSVIANKTKIKTVCDLRKQDVSMGGSGAPLVPVGDEILFSEYDYCLNLGGFSNISTRKNNIRIAYDICPVNTIINYLCNKIDLEFDDKGQHAKLGKINKPLLNKLNKLTYFKTQPPKSLGIEWLRNSFIPIVESYSIDIHDKLRTIYELISIQITKNVNNNKNSSILITGGGAYNDFLIELIRNKTNCKIILPSNEIIEFKEAIIFAFLGLLRLNNEINCLASVTGASHDHSSGIIYDF